MLKSVVGLVLVLVATLAHADRIRDLTSVQGVRENSLIGYGLVVGLDGTGDQTTQTPFTTQTLNNMLSQLGITVPTGTNMQLKNVAAVMVTASFPAFGRQGQTIDVVVSSLGNAKSLRGGDAVDDAVERGRQPGVCAGAGQHFSWWRRGVCGRQQRAGEPA